jgi:phosphoribosylglycinamide formyltransferase-1
MTIRLGWFSTGRDRAALDLFAAVQDRIDAGEIDALITYVFCNRERGEAEITDAFLDEVAARNIPVIAFSSRRFEPEMRRDPATREAWREAFDSEAIARLREIPVDMVVQAGYMLIMSPLLCRSFHMINLHPAVPGGPKGTWQECMWQLIEAGAQAAGGMMHLVTAELDEGPAISYFEFPIRGPGFDSLWSRLEEKLKSKSISGIKAAEGESEPLFARIREEELAREFPLLIYTIREVAAGRIVLREGRVIVGGKPVSGGVDLSDFIEAEVKGKKG